jgi:hypothetical protein
MRWYFSIGAVVVVAGAIAAGDVAGIAAPDSRSQLTDAKDNFALRRYRTRHRRRYLLFDG